MRLTCSEIAGAVKAIHCVVGASVVPSGYSIDSRTISVGECFFAIRGPNFDGHDFIAEAVSKGASCVVASVREVPQANPSFPLMTVADTSLALQHLANYARKKWGRLVIGITGSTGKTTTKEILGLLLQARYRVFKTTGNFNNDFGLPLSILRMKEEHEVAVLELGMSRAGEIRRLCQIAEPHIGIVTNVRPVHLQNFQSIRGVAEAKRELIESLPVDGVAVLNNDDRLVRKFGRSFKGEVITFGVDTVATYRASVLRSTGLDGTEFQLIHKSKCHPLRIPLPGRHNVTNALPAIAVANHLGLEFETISKSLLSLRPTEGRGEVLTFQNQFTLLNDSYNSNPAAMDAVIRCVEALPGFRRKILVAGEMLELGPRAEEFHRTVGVQAARSKFDLVIGVRGLAEFICQAASEFSASPPEARFFADSVAAGEWLTRIVQAGDLIVVKGSRGVRTERIIDILRRDHALAPRSA